MKKNLISLLILLTSQSMGQGIVPITFGPLVSMSSTSLSSKPDFVDQVAGSGFNAGAFVRLKVLFLYAQGEASFGSRSASVTVNDTGINKNITFKLKGLDLTALVGSKLFGIGDYGNFRIFAGYNWNNYTDITYSIDGNIFSTSNVNKNNHSLIGGFGLDLSKLSFDLKFIKGFIDITKSGSADVESRVLNITVSFRIK